MTLVDTSVWVDHLRRGSRRLADELEHAEVWSHPFVIGEISCGRLGARSQVLTELAALPSAPVAQHDEALSLVESHALTGTGIGWIDVHLLASALLAGTKLWTLDKSLHAAATRLGIQFSL